MSTAVSEQLDRIFDVYSEEEGFERVLMTYKTHEVLGHVRGGAVLDLGCGVGSLCRALADRVESVVGLDGSPVKVERARQLNGAANITYVCALFEAWTPDRTFDSIVCTNVLEHVKDVPAFLQICRKALAPGGRLIATVPNALGLHKRIGLEMGLIDDLYALTAADRAKGHERIYDRQRLESDLGAGGFEIACSGGILLKPLSHEQMASWDRPIVNALYKVGKELPDYCSSLIVVGTKLSPPIGSSSTPDSEDRIHERTLR